MSREKQKPELNLRSKASGPERCSLCRDDLLTPKAQTCTGCGASYHPSCLREFGTTCATPGCGAEVASEPPELSVQARPQQARGRSGYPSPTAWVTAGVLTALPFWAQFTFGETLDWRLLILLPVSWLIGAFVVEELLDLWRHLNRRR